MFSANYVVAKFKRVFFLLKIATCVFSWVELSDINNLHYYSMTTEDIYL